MRTMNYQRYESYPAVDLPDRRWPLARISQAPRWCSVDLRDGNQALHIPMDVEKKMRLFELLVQTGFKEIEVGFPSAAEVEFQFVRRLIEEQRIPEDVTIQVLVQAREHLIRRTFEALRGVHKAIVHLYNSTSPVQREVVFGMDKKQVCDLAVKGARMVKSLAAAFPAGAIRFEYSPESFTGTELDYALDVVCAVMDVWQPHPQEPMIINLPATVEMSTPNIYADRIEWFVRHMPQRQSVILSIHTHNDRGTAVAAAELAVMAGAQRVEGALFGNGERSGNMDIVVMAMNLFSQGVDPQLDFSDMDKVMAVYTQCTGMEVHPRHPYAGSLVYTAFSGSHQDAIYKSMNSPRCSSARRWAVPYLPIDPHDVGRTYEAIIRINSQSGKGGAAYILEHDYGIPMPKWMKADFGRAVQALAERTGAEVTAAQLYDLFRQEYVAREQPWSLRQCHIDSENSIFERQFGPTAHVRAVLSDEGHQVGFSESGNGPVDAFVKGFKKISGIAFSLQEYAEYAIDQGEDARAAAYVLLEIAEKGQIIGVGIDSNIAIASMKAVIAAVNRAK
ncbi:MAG: 2-isopropylmalate synthase [Candidatus Omnitrophica bacterium]|nr:2-isopropylmalate synthase [Candidatus Omnitrophota bacterium]